MPRLKHKGKLPTETRKDHYAQLESFQRDAQILTMVTKQNYIKSCFFLNSESAEHNYLQSADK